MQIQDLLVTVRWWAYFLVIGLVFFPLVRRLFSSFLDKGYLFSKIIGVSLISYIVFVLGITHLAPFVHLTILGVIVGCAVIMTILLVKFPQKNNFSKSFLFLIVFEEILFLAALLFWATIRAHQPDIFGLEKYMDFGFVNSILRSTYFPPRDMWYTPLPINYYYFGHLVTAVLTKLTGIPSSISFNLMLATLFAFTFSLSFSIAGNLWHTFLQYKEKIKLSVVKFISAGIIGSFLVALSGNLHTIYTFFTPYSTDNPVPFWQLVFSPKTFPNSYWYPNATRFIYHTIHEFPSYSFVVSDLHGHVLDIPLVLTTLAVLFTILLKPIDKPAKTLFSFFSENTIWIFYGLLLSLMYMTNAWDGMIYTIVSIPVIIYKNYQQQHSIVKSIFSFATVRKIIILFACFFLFSLPFSLFFNPGALVGGIGLICSPDFLIHIGKIGPFVFEPNHCMHSPLWQLLILYGFFLFWLISFIFIIVKQRKQLSPADFFAAVLSGTAFFLVIIPEFFYLRDIYTTYFRANTMFKLVYQAFIMFSLATSYTMFRFVHLFVISKLALWRRALLLPYLFVGIGFFALVGMYSYFAIFSYYGNLTTYKGLNGTNYLTKTYPDDAAGIAWINQHISGLPVILEAQGDSYTEYARVSANTGLPTVLGWPVHEWLWRGTYDIVPPRSRDIQTMYETTDIETFKQLVNKYNIQYVFVGQLERTKYTNLHEDKFLEVGKVVFAKGVTRIYQLSF